MMTLSTFSPQVCGYINGYDVQKIIKDRKRERSNSARTKIPQTSFLVFLLKVSLHFFSMLRQNGVHNSKKVTVG